MTWPRYGAICALWRETPPVAVSVYAIARRLDALGPPAKAGAKPPQAEKRQGLIDELAGADGVKTGLPDWLVAARKAEQQKGA